jgi:hypothetical protein
MRLLALARARRFGDPMLHVRVDHEQDPIARTVVSV